MRTAFVALFAALSLLAPSSAALAAAKGKTAAPKAPPGGVTEANVAASVKEFVDALNSLDEDRVLAAIAAGDRLALGGRDNMLGIVYGQRIQNPALKSFEKLEKGGKVLGAKAIVSIEEVDPIDSTAKTRERTWFLSLEGNALRVSLSSVWLDAGKVGEAKDQ